MNIKHAMWHLVHIHLKSITLNPTPPHFKSTQPLSILILPRLCIIFVYLEYDEFDFVFGLN